MYIAGFKGHITCHLHSCTCKERWCNGYFQYTRVLHVKQPEAETSLVYDVFIWVIKKRAQAERGMREKEKEINM